MIFRLDLLVALSILLSFFWINASLLGAGSSMLLFLILLSLTLLAKKKVKRKNNLNRKVFWSYTLYSVSTITALLVAGHTTSEDIRYWISILLTSLVFILIPNTDTKTGKKFFAGVRIGALLTGVAIIIVWISLVISNLDFFILRSGSNHDLTSDWQLTTLFSNSNLTARVSILLLVIFLFYSKINTGKTNQQFLILATMISVLILSTLSRSNIASLILIWGGYSILLLTSSKKIILLILLGMIGISSAVFNENVYNRINEISNYSFTSDENRRSRSWQASLNMIKSSPLLGVGKSNELDQMESWGSITRNASEKIIVTHGGFLKIGVYTGLISLFLMIVVFLKLILIFYNNYRSHQINSKKVASAMGLLTVVSLIPMNIGADGLGLFITWFVISFFLEFSSTVLRTG